MYINKDLYQKTNSDLIVGDDVLMEYQNNLMYYSFFTDSPQSCIQRGIVKKLFKAKLPQDFYKMVRDCENHTTSGGVDYLSWSSEFAILEIKGEEKTVLRWVARDKKTGFWNGYGTIGSLMVRKSVVKISWDKVCLSEVKKKAILDTLAQVEYSALIFDTWGFSQTIEKGRALTFLFFGPPGTGKTLTAQAIADYLNFDLMVITPTDLNDKYFGETEKRIREVFNKADSKTVILFDECDGLIMDRQRGSGITVPHINQFIYDLEHFDGICIFTTNNIDFLDKALERRVALKIEFENPTEEIRIMIWRKLIPPQCPLDKDVNLNFLGRFPLNGGHIKNVVLNAARFAAKDRVKSISMKYFIEAIQLENNGIKGFNKIQIEKEVNT